MADPVRIDICRTEDIIVSGLKGPGCRIWCLDEPRRKVGDPTFASPYRLIGESYTHDILTNGLVRYSVGTRLKHCRPKRVSEDYDSYHGDSKCSLKVMISAALDRSTSTNCHLNESFDRTSGYERDEGCEINYVVVKYNLWDREKEAKIYQDNPHREQNQRISSIPYTPHQFQPSDRGQYEHGEELRNGKANMPQTLP